LKNPASKQGATDKQILRFFGESACPCPFLQSEERHGQGRPSQEAAWSSLSVAHCNCLVILTARASSTRPQGLVEKGRTRVSGLPKLDFSVGRTLLSVLQSRAGTAFSTRLAGAGHLDNRSIVSILLCGRLVVRGSFAHAPGGTDLQREWPPDSVGWNIEMKSTTAGHCTRIPMVGLPLEKARLFAAPGARCAPLRLASSVRSS